MARRPVQIEPGLFRSTETGQRKLEPRLWVPAEMTQRRRSPPRDTRGRRPSGSKRARSPAGRIASFLGTGRDAIMGRTIRYGLAEYQR